MKKSFTIGIVAVFLISGWGVVALAEHEQTPLKKTEFLSFSPITIQENEGFTTVNLAEETSHITSPGSYTLPVVTRVYTFPFKTKINDVVVSFSEVQEKTVSKPIRHTLQPIADNMVELLAAPVASFLAVCPEQRFSYHIAAGQDGNNLVTYLALHMYPVEYKPQEEKLLYAQNAEITITYTLPEIQPTVKADQYKLVIIAPKEFTKALQPLVDHKIGKGFTTKLVTVEDVCNGILFSVQGRDCAEKMKYFIKNAFDQWGTSYVLLVGGRKGGILQETWWIPVRYSKLNDGGEGSYLTDLYFADLYDAGGNFSSWDSNNNSVFAEWDESRKDVFDMYPEVYVGRLPCTNTREVKIIVDKIINYENTAYGTEWFKKFVGIAGDTYPEISDPYYEGELATNASFNQLQSLGFQASFVWTSNRKFNGADAVIEEINKGCGFVHFSGHGNPHIWGNHPPKNESFVYGPNSFEMKKLTNGERQPIVIVGGCHNAQYNTSLLNILRGLLDDGFHYFSAKSPYGAFWYNEWIPRCWAWAMTTNSKGGCIGIIANTGLGYGEPGENTLTEKGRFLEWLFFKSYSEGKDLLGETHAQSLVYYMNEHPPMDDQVDCKIIQEWGLLGDPSLKIGGYPS